MTTPSGTPISGKKVRITDKDSQPTKRAIGFQSKDPSISTTGINPPADGAVLHVFNASGGSDSSKAKGASPISYTLDEASQGSVGVIFRTGSTSLCALFGGTVKTDSGTDPPNAGGKGQFGAQAALAPGACPIPPVSCP